MKFLIVSERGDFSGAALRLVKEGNEVRIYFKLPRARKTMAGLLEQVSTINEGVSWAPDIIVFDMVGMGQVADKLRRDGWNVIGGSMVADKLELDRAYGISAMKSFGIGTPATYEFASMKEAASFALSHNRKLVLKPSDNKSTGYTFVPKSNDELISFIAHLRKQGVEGRCILQEFINGAEISTEVWYTHGKPIPYPNSTIELKKFLPQDLGISTGSQASVVWNYPTKEPKIVQKSLKRLGILLEKAKYTGPLDINGIVRGGKFYGLEFSARFGYNALYAWLQLLDEDFGAVLARMAMADPKPIRFRPGYASSLRVSVPPYPYEPSNPKTTAEIYDATKGFYVGGVEANAWGKTVFPLDISATKAGLITAGFDGIIAEVCGSGEDVFQAYASAEQRVKKIEIPNKQARLGDLVERVLRVTADLSVQGYEVPPWFGRPPVLTVNVPQKTIEPKESTTNESNSANIPAHMARTTISMPTKLSDKSGTD